jgi:hypothetical protein
VAKHSVHDEKRLDMKILKTKPLENRRGVVAAKRNTTALPVYYSPKDMLHWTHFRHGKRFSPADLVAEFRNALQDGSIPFCCILHFVLGEFLTNKVQSMQRGEIILHGYYPDGSGSGFIPCWFHRRKHWSNNTEEKKRVHSFVMQWTRNKRQSQHQSAVIKG